MIDRKFHCGQLSIATPIDCHTRTQFVHCLFPPQTTRFSNADKLMNGQISKLIYSLLQPIHSQSYLCIVVSNNEFEF